MWEFSWSTVWCWQLVLRETTFHFRCQQCCGMSTPRRVAAELTAEKPGILDILARGVFLKRLWTSFFEFSVSYQSTSEHILSITTSSETATIVSSTDSFHGSASCIHLNDPFATTLDLKSICLQGIPSRTAHMFLIILASTIFVAHMLSCPHEDPWDQEEGKDQDDVVGTSEG